MSGDDDDAGRRAEAARQQALLAALWSDGPPPPGLQAGRATPARALDAWRANAGAAAERALAASFPVVRAVVGDDAFAGLARAWWHAAPPARGDLAWLGEGLPDFIGADPQLAGLPWLADLARLEWAVARAESAADAVPDAAALALLAERDAGTLRLVLPPGAALVASRWPVVALWRAHRAVDEDGDLRPGLVIDDGRLAAARDALAAGVAQAAFVARPAWAVRVVAVDPAQAALLAATLAGADLGAAADTALAVDPAWSFEAWLADAWPAGRLAGVQAIG